VEPSPFYRQHVALDAPEINGSSFRPFWRIRTHLDQLALDGTISHAEWLAARQFHRWAAIVLAGAWGSQSLDRTDAAPIADSLILARRIDARDALHRVRSELGPVAFALLEAHIVNDETWRQIARRFAVTPPTARKWVIIALRALVGTIRT
jgi:hypothetical protein